MSLAGLLGTGFGSGSIPSGPDVPSITVVDDADGTGVTVTISDSSASSSNQVYYQEVDADFGTIGNWTAGDSRSGDGAIAQALDNGWYWIQVRSTLNSQTKATLSVFVHVTDGTDALLKQIIEAVQTRIRALSLANISSGNVVTRKLNVDQGVGTGQAVTYPCCIVSPGPSELANPNAGTNAADDYGYPIQITLLDKITHNSTQLDIENQALLWRQQIVLAFQNQRLPGVTKVYTCQVQPQRIVDPAAWTSGGGRHKTELLLRFMARQQRGVT